MGKNSSFINTSNATWKIGLCLIFFALVMRIALPPFIHHPPNFSPIDAIALFCGAHVRKRFIALLITLSTVLISDIFLNKISMGHWIFFYTGCYWQYGSYCLITFLGATLNSKFKWIHLPPTCLAASIIFFAISNFGVWVSGFLYPLTLEGLFNCYAAAIPFFKNTCLSDLFFSFLLFMSASLFISPRWRERHVLKGEVK